MCQRAPKYWKLRRGHEQGFKMFPGPRFKGKARIAIYQVMPDWKHDGLKNMTPDKGYFVVGVKWINDKGSLAGISHYIISDDIGEIRVIAKDWFEPKLLTIQEYSQRHE